MTKPQFWLDQGVLEKYVKRQLELHDFFASLKEIRILLTWRREPKKDDEGCLIAAQARKLSPKLRDILDKDVEIEVCKDIWRNLTKYQKRRVIYHELLHFDPVIDDDGTLERDKSGRVKVNLRKHDIIVKTFSSEVTRFGPERHDEKIAKFVLSARRSKEERKGGKENSTSPKE